MTYTSVGSMNPYNVEIDWISRGQMGMPADDPHWEAGSKGSTLPLLPKFVRNAVQQLLTPVYGQILLDYTEY